MYSSNSKLLDITVSYINIRFQTFENTWVCVGKRSNAEISGSKKKNNQKCELQSHNPLNDMTYVMFNIMLVTVFSKLFNKYLLDQH